MRTTIYIDDDIYKKLVDKSVDTFGTAKNISAVLNNLLREILKTKEKQKREDYSGKFGKMKFGMDDLRDENDRAF